MCLALFCKNQEWSQAHLHDADTLTHIRKQYSDRPITVAPGHEEVQVACRVLA